MFNELMLVLSREQMLEYLNQALEEDEPMLQFCSNKWRATDCDIVDGEFQITYARKDDDA